MYIYISSSHVELQICGSIERGGSIHPVGASTARSTLTLHSISRIEPDLLIAFKLAGLAVFDFELSNWLFCIYILHIAKPKWENYRAMATYTHIYGATRHFQKFDRGDVVRQIKGKRMSILLQMANECTNVAYGPMHVYVVELFVLIWKWRMWINAKPNQTIPQNFLQRRHHK